MMNMGLMSVKQSIVLHPPLVEYQITASLTEVASN